MRAPVLAENRGGPDRIATLSCISPAVIFEGSCCTSLNPGDCQVMTTTGVLVSSMVPNSIITTATPVWAASPKSGEPTALPGQSTEENTKISRSFESARTRTQLSRGSITTVVPTNLITSIVTEDVTTQISITLPLPPSSITTITISPISTTSVLSTISTTTSPATSPTSSPTAAPAPLATPSTSTPPNKAAIAAGTTIAILSLLGLLIFFLIRRKRANPSKPLIPFLHPSPGYAQSRFKHGRKLPINIGSPTGVQTLNENNEWVPGIQPRLGSLKANSILQHPSLVDDDAVRLDWERDGGEYRDHVPRTLQPGWFSRPVSRVIVEEEGEGRDIPLKTVSEERAGVRSSYVAYSRPE
ncbi:hypothetical protein GLAREA_08559 [Glarea lozoyensis ATCC 20868]|uniref:Uncharacterized protein n=1 Tax=Glarea lozoyensis (strain ATCC 20868 / MF5171) TaxID=1116229 RepID=S3CXZ9_GLAL2|nr:uncharacterized protein GLAREA_08559 [Glarea lozoyensis ATCC 20868]EPE24706.1 hypothetical protein GLAREA_08559 [Glarea lozoyensis ATCC 20868]